MFQKNQKPLEIILITCVSCMVSLMTYCIRSLPLLPKQRSYLYSVVEQIRDLCLKKKKSEEIKFELVLLCHLRVMALYFALWCTADNLVWDLAIAGMVHIGTK